MLSECEDLQAAVASSFAQINQADLKELSSFANPPAIAKSVTSALITLLGGKDNSWAAFKKEKHILTKLNELSVENVKSKNMNSLRS